MSNKRMRSATKLGWCILIGIFILLLGVYLNTMAKYKIFQTKIYFPYTPPSKIPEIIKDNIKNKNNYDLRVNIADNLFDYTVMIGNQKYSSEQSRDKLAVDISKYVDSISNKTLDCLGGDNIYMSVISPKSKINNKNEIVLNFNNKDYLVSKDSGNIF